MYRRRLFCPKCEDMFKLRSTMRTCSCGACHGRYLADGLHAEISENAVAVGIGNQGFLGAWMNTHLHKLENKNEFKAWIIPFSSDRVKRLKVE
jgi:hypothetical protein